MTNEEVARLTQYIHEQVRIVRDNSEEARIVTDRLGDTFLDANAECVRRVKVDARKEAEIYLAVLEYTIRARKHDGRVAARQAVEGKFETLADFERWVSVWDPL